jgi:hypothetical protein
MKYTSACGGQRTMKIIPPHPPLEKGGEGGFSGEKLLPPLVHELLKKVKA